MDMDISVKFNTWFMILSGWYEDIYYERRYNGYEIEEAKELFRQYVEEENAKIFINT